jgi:hypothetical protein
VSGSNLGFYRSINWDAGPSSATWQLLSPAHPNGSFDLVKDFNADANTYGLVYVFEGSGCMYNQFNFLLKRDIGNDPMWLEKAA